MKLRRNGGVAMFIYDQGHQKEEKNEGSEEEEKIKVDKRSKRGV